jgi:alkylhydroperoxidase family enzyme
MNLKLVDLPEVAEMSEEQLEVYNKFPSNLTRSLLLTKCSAGPHLALGGAFTIGYLSNLEREVIVMRVAKILDSDFERMIHYPLALKAGLTEQEIDDIENANYENMQPKRIAMLRYISECTIDHKATPESFTELNKFYSQGEIADATHLAGHCAMTAMYLASLAIPLDFGIFNIR